VFWAYLAIPIQIGLAVNNSDKYRVIQEETTGSWKVIVSIIVGK
jgi:hypothetical protein